MITEGANLSRVNADWQAKPSVKGYSSMLLAKDIVYHFQRLIIAASTLSGQTVQSAGVT